MSTKREWLVVDFGKYKGKSLPQIMFSDPDWFFYAYSEGYFNSKGNLRIEANEISKKSVSIKIPQKGPVKLVAEYTIHPTTHNFCDLEIVPVDRDPHHGSFRKDVIDMTIPKQIQKYDKFGYKILISCIKTYLFGNTKIKMTKERCEEFFSNNENFVL